MAESGPRRKLAAILAADVVGFSKMMGENEDRNGKSHSLSIASCAMGNQSKELKQIGI